VSDFENELEDYEEKIILTYIKDKRKYTFELKETSKGKKYIEICDHWSFKGKPVVSKIILHQEIIPGFTKVFSKIVKEVYPLNDVMDIYPETETQNKNDKSKSTSKRKAQWQYNSREGNKWTLEEEAQLLELNDRDCSIGEIAYKLERSKGSIVAKLKKLGFEK
jgi:predicted DNA-binding protein YlxM (UPF0122 family)